MKKIGEGLLIFAICAGLITCTMSSQKPKLHYYHGTTIPNQYITVLNYTATEIEFRINARFPLKQAYHLVLEGDIPLAEGWYPASRPELDFYTVKLKANKGISFQTGKTYRLCVGAESPDFIAVHSSNYRCIIDYEFVLEGEKRLP